MILAVGCLLGILTHILIKINDLNRATNGAFKFGPFIRLEWASICLSVVFCTALLIGRNEIKQLKEAGGWLFLSFYAIGLTSQYIAYKANGAATRKVKQILGPDDKPE